MEAVDVEGSPHARVFHEDPLHLLDSLLRAQVGVRVCHGGTTMFHPPVVEELLCDICCVLGTAVGGDLFGHAKCGKCITEVVDEPSGALI